MGKHVMITGATGMIGGLVMKLCLQSPDVAKVVSLVRKHGGIDDPKLHEVVIEDFITLDTDMDCFKQVDVVFYCLGVYTGAVDKERFRTITVDYPVALASVLRPYNPDMRFCLLSGAGADRTEKSRIMFARDKGAAENQLSQVGLGPFHTFRPSYIYPVTPRQEPNLSYRMYRYFYPLVKHLGPNRSIKSTELAGVMFSVGIYGCDQEILENKDILRKVSA